MKKLGIVLAALIAIASIAPTFAESRDMHGDRHGDRHDDRHDRHHHDDHHRGHSLIRKLLH
jgi:Ni/Co efflux regulator RcnB